MTHRLIAASVALLLAQVVHADDRPARLRLRTAPGTARGLAPEASRPATWADIPSDVIRPLTEAEAAAFAPPTPSGPLLDLSRLRASLFGQRVSLTQPTPVPTYAAEPVAQSVPAAPTIYARGPAYRWYGWGAMPPGREAASTPPSESWMAQTGATRGAFPIGTTAPEVAAPNPPAAMPPPPPMVAAIPANVPPPPVEAFDPNQPVSMTNLPQLPPGAVLVDASVAPSPVPMIGVPMTPVTPQSPAVVPVSETAAPPMSGPPQAWKPVPPAVAPAIVQASATVPVPDFVPPIERSVREAAKGLGVVKAVRFPKPGTMTVALRCKNAADANAAAKAISSLPAVTPLAVEFAVELE